MSTRLNMISKFKVGDRIEMNTDALVMRLDGCKGVRTGIVKAVKGSGLIVVLRDGLRQNELWASSFWNLVDVNKPV